MHLLKLDDHGKPILTQFLAGNIPSYAILSHAWEADDQEVAFKDFITGVGLNMLGYGKIRFCEEQARKDSLQYFWVDSCRIISYNVFNNALQRRLLPLRTTDVVFSKFRP
jgi:hypothetical protein